MALFRARSAPLVALCALALAGSGPSQARADEAGYLGIQVRADDQGALVVAVFPDSGAAAAGLSEGDLLTAADDRSLAGLGLKSIVGCLKGPVASSLRLTVLPFPAGEPLELVVQRGPKPRGAQPPEGKSYLPVVDREANILGSNLRAGRSLKLDRALDAWRASADSARVDAALLRFLREADSLGWARGGKLGAEQRAAFWGQLAQHEGLAKFLAERSPQTRLQAARYLALHRPSAGLALDLLEALPQDDLSQLRQATASLALAVQTGDGSAAVAAGAQDADILAGQDLRLVFGPAPGDRAALELVLDSEAAPEDPASALPAEARQRLERSGLALPWAPPSERSAFGALPPPRAPALDVERLGGGRLELAAHVGPALLAFWATWCGPCMEELKQLQRLSDELAEQGLAVWAISIDKQPEAVPATVERLGLSIPVGLGGGKAARAWGVDSVPRSFLLDGQHGVAADHAGYATESFEELTAQARSVVAGTAVVRQLGELSFGSQALQLLGGGPLEGRARLLLADSVGRGWVALGSERSLLPLVLDEGAISVDRQGAVPLPFPADLALFRDLDGDGQQELVCAQRGKGPVRACELDGSPLWTQRDHDGVAALASLSLADGRPALAVLRIEPVLQDHPLGPLANGEARPQVLEQRPRLELLDAQGRLLARTALPSPVINMAAHPNGQQVRLLLKDSLLRNAHADGRLELLPAGPERLRRVHALDPLVTGWAPGPICTSHTARDVYAGRFGPSGSPSLLALTSGGDIHGLDLQGRHRFWLALQRRPLVAVTDLDSDGRQELTLWAQWFGLAALGTAY